MRSVLLLILFITLSSAEILEAKYKITYGIFGKIGYAVARLETRGQRYSISVKAKATGLAKILSNGRREEYISQGYIKNGMFIPDLYKKIRSNSTKKDIKIYSFDHSRRVVHLRTKRFKNGKLDHDSEETLPFYAKEDILSLYFNLPLHLHKEAKHLILHAVGGDRKTGRVDIYLPAGEELKKLKRLLRIKEGKIVDVVIHQKIFSSKNGRLHIALQKNSPIAKKALLKDVILFGDITGTLEKVTKK